MLEHIDKAIEIYNPSHLFALFSGGHDSYVATHIASQHPAFSGVCHINTGIGIEQTRQFVRDRCAAHGWQLLEKKAVENRNGKGEPDPQVYDDLVLERGFPGPPQHNKMYSRLKDRCVNALIREHKQEIKLPDGNKRNKYFDKILLITGGRSSESKRRMGYMEAIQLDRVSQARVWVAPIIDWTKGQVDEYMAANDLPRNSVVDILHMSGECLCGAFAEQGELELICTFFPDTGRRLVDLQERVMAKFPWRWDDRPPEWWLEVQNGQEFLPLCRDCIHSPKSR